MGDLWIHPKEPGEVHGRSGRLSQLRSKLCEEIVGVLKASPVHPGALVDQPLVRFDINAHHDRNSLHAECPWMRRQSMPHVMWFRLAVAPLISSLAPWVNGNSPLDSPRGRCIISQVFRDADDEAEAIQALDREGPHIRHHLGQSAFAINPPSPAVTTLVGLKEKTSQVPNPPAGRP